MMTTNDLGVLSSHFTILYYVGVQNSCVMMNGP